MKEIIERINSLRGSTSVNAFAKTLGMCQRTLDMYLKGINKPSVDFIKKVSSNCGVTADWLLGLDDSRVGKKSSAPPVADGSAQEKIAELEKEISRLRGENEGLRFAINTVASSLQQETSRNSPRASSKKITA